MDTIGLDLHKRESQLSIVTEDGELIERCIATSRESFTTVLGSRPPSRILLERVGGTVPGVARSRGDRRRPELRAHVRYPIETGEDR